MDTVCALTPNKANVLVDNGKMKNGYCSSNKEQTKPGISKGRSTSYMNARCSDSYRRVFSNSTDTIHGRSADNINQSPTNKITLQHVDLIFLLQLLDIHP